MLAGRIGERNSNRMPALDSAAAYVAASFKALGLQVVEQTYVVYGKTFRNIEVTLPGTSRPKEIIVVGGHYDSVFGTPGADDNASGASAVLELARLLQTDPHPRTIKLVAFTNEEPPWFFTEDMGSRHYARAARARGDDIVAMLAIETIGYYSDRDGSQRYPPILGWFYPKRGNFIGVVGNIASRSLVHRVIRDFREFAEFPSVGTAAPMQIPGISWSDQWSFWKEGYDAVMITDTAPFRNNNYHELWDRPDSLNYGHMARVVQGVARTVAELATGPSR
jgi:Zn-dependent M28 family amino/carboxypeptidase